MKLLRSKINIMVISDSDKLRFYDDKKKEYSIAELTEATGLKPRTIYYYVQEKIIPGPTGAGSSARYDEEHRIKLLLIKKLQDEQRMNLRVIRNILEDIEFVHAPMPGVPAIPAGEDELDIILDHFIRAASKRDKSFGPAAMVSDALEMGEDSATERNNLTMRAQAKRKAEPAASRVDLNLWRSAQMPLSYKRESEEDEKIWRKEMIVDGMDLYVRRDIERKYGNEIRDQILELKKKIKESKKV